MPGREETFVYKKKTNLKTENARPGGNICILKKTNLKTENAGPGGNICIYKKDKPEDRKCRAGR
jgi:hypothetical protein